MIKKKFNKINNEEVKLLSSEIINEGGTVLSNLFNYSTDEMIIGTWVTGKPIYRKIIRGRTDSTSTQTTFGQISDVDEVLDLRGIINTDSKYGVPFGYISPTELTSNYVNGYFNPLKEGITVEYSTGYRNGLAIITIEYTKTTD